VLQSLLLGFRVLRGDVKVRLRPVAGIYQPILRTIWWGEK
jgi:hypothetical protein